MAMETPTYETVGSSRDVSHLDQGIGGLFMPEQLEFLNKAMLGEMLQKTRCCSEIDWVIHGMIFETCIKNKH